MHKKLHTIAIFITICFQLSVVQIAKSGTLSVTVLNNKSNPITDAIVSAYPMTAPATQPTDTLIATMKQKDSAFVPKILPIQTGTKVHFPNEDNMNHHVYSFSPAKTFELKLYKENTPDPVLFDKAGVIAIGCNIHDWMVGYIYVVDTPFFAKTDINGQVTLSLPPDSYKVTLWHPSMLTAPSTHEAVVKISDGKTDINFEYTTPQ